MGSQRYYLSSATKNLQRKGAQGLHVAIWEFYSGKTVQKGYVVHHKDGNPFNNSYENLECVSAKQHMQAHWKINKTNDALMQKYRDILHKNRYKAIAWHKSSEGRAWHKENAKTSILKIFYERQFVCQECNNTFISRNPTANSCSQYCTNKRRYNRLRNEKEQYICVVCEAIFVASKNPNHKRQRKTCSRGCARKIADTSRL